jgi:hypothetical protein
MIAASVRPPIFMIMRLDRFEIAVEGAMQYAVSGS